VFGLLSPLFWGIDEQTLQKKGLKFVIDEEKKPTRRTRHQGWRQIAGMVWDNNLIDS
jgi:hypothetical protein